MLKKNSKKVKPGDSFVVIDDGIKYIDEAIDNGAVRIISTQKYKNIDTLIVNDPLNYYNNYIYNIYYNKIKDIKLIGITGTNGKTTTAYLIYQMLNKLNIKCAYIGTIGFYHNKTYDEISHTTPDIDDLYEMLEICKNENIEYVVMEVSSHALKQNRIYGLKFDITIFTNFTQDHLDYHETMNDYLESKIKLFELLKEKGTAIINSDDENYKNFILKQNKNILVGLNGDVKINNIVLNHNKTDVEFLYDKAYYKSLNMVGKYNAYNYLEAVTTLHCIGFNIDKILELDITAPPGRMELIKYKNNSIFIDYAHTPDAFTNVLNCVNELKVNKIITIFGCGGNRDSSKRKIMGDIATKISDYVIITDDNPRNEDGDLIIKDIISGIEKNNYEVIRKRKEAIKKGVELLTDNDILMILGKGHENYQIIGDTKHHFDDREAVEELIKHI